ncbi:TetR/AcrR family transcriptional regulator [Thermomonospora umbrina]|uniref:TetR family transcriptional regulator n=1 Tax=Thermomonospora umbrina TaxID=111806 RepID=A0A3D9SIP1_9ACTN|nr:TetR/AcrR family transcriptional regulator [Thermomonospora umbrina]REE95798.1 TetR family transcriptional regulator [Thermomonospora umbrina]
MTAGEHEATGGRPRRVTRRRAETRRRLLDAALDVFAERGLRGASIEEVCDRAGYTRGAFYSNFRTMDELLLAVSEDYSHQILEKLRTTLLDLPDGLPEGFDVVDVAIDMVLAVMPDDRRWWLVETELVLHAARNPEAAEAVRGQRERFAAEFTALVAWAVERVGREFTSSPEDLVRVIHALHDGSLAQRHLEPDAVPPGHLERLALPALLRAFSRPAGRPGD